jgi:hypothetical protein
MLFLGWQSRRAGGYGELNVIVIECSSRFGVDNQEPTQVCSILYLSPNYIARVMHIAVEGSPQNDVLILLPHFKHLLTLHNTLPQGSRRNCGLHTHVTICIDFPRLTDLEMARWR